MAQRIPIQLHVGSPSVARHSLSSPADALKEHVSNAIDEHLKAKLEDTAHDRCDVTFTLDRRHVTIEYRGMSRAESRRRCSGSPIRRSARGRCDDWRLGIDLQLSAGRAEVHVYTRKTRLSETLRVVLKEGSDEASFDTAPSRESLAGPGLRVVISELKFDPTRSRGPLAPDTLRRYLAEKFEAYLREGWLAIEIRTGVARFPVVPSRIRLPRLLADIRELVLPQASDKDKKMRLELYFDPSGRGRVAIRHRGVTVVDDLAALTAYGLEESAWAQGFVRGVFDADFLSPLPARSGFEENADWIAVLDLLDRYLPTLEAELEGHLAAYRARQASEIGDRALRLARDILDLDEFRDLALPGGLAKRGRPEPTTTPGAVTNGRQRRRGGAPPVAPGAAPSPRGRRISEEVPRGRIEGAQPVRVRSRAGQHSAPRFSGRRPIGRPAPGVCGFDDRQGIDRVQRSDGNFSRLPREAARLLFQAARAGPQAGQTAHGGGRRGRAGAARADGAWSRRCAAVRAGLKTCPTTRIHHGAAEAGHHVSPIP